ncbi:formylglycine-generating enzyme family protein [Arthrobacter sp. H5]|uniref:formylglycine-generating enzyme family protein n=1 Tax=Arthrobacter sp. H5 TaxID=1267973 RepID=UPI0004AE2C79|nr:formylglycine-generating enzyme family protein [Arthrobacter sp. H5]
MLPKASFLMGDSTGDGNPVDGEEPVHTVVVGPIEMDATTVTNLDFDRFVSDTHYQTDAERSGVSAVFHSLVVAPVEDVVGRVRQSPWWAGVSGADWRRPYGRESSIEGLEDHPVVHVSWNDAMAYCEWADRRLPTEAEWEYASRGGLQAKRYPWGDELPGGGKWPTNIWQGVFPAQNSKDDGWAATAPVRSYKPNGFGLWQTVGNVWEWCADWFDTNYYRSSPQQNPKGSPLGKSRVLRGGSYLCHDSYCNRYRNSARSHNRPESTSGNVGFRTVGQAN